MGRETPYTIMNHPKRLKSLFSNCQNRYFSTYLSFGLKAQRLENAEIRILFEKKD
jgi:hypothetical protein